MSGSNPHVDGLPGALPSPVVVGVAGAIGAGKSAVARALGEAGCLVIDFDAEAKAALDLPAVRERVSERLGPAAARAGVALIDGSGLFDRAALARVIFADASARKVLESIVHPVVWRTKEAARAEAEAAGVWGIVLDAPLLFEAGLDGSCDVVVFVDAPRATRLARVTQGRGWDADELDRREAAQMDAGEKRRRSHAVVENAGGLAELRSQVGAISAILRSRASTGPRSPLGGG